MNHKKYDLDVSRLSTQIQEDVTRIFTWLEKNVMQPTPVDKNALSPDPDAEPSMDKIEHTLEMMDYPYAEFNKEHYVAHLATMLRREVELVPMVLSRALSGACVRQFHMDHIFYNKNRHPLLQDHVVLHESAHLLLNHRLRKISLSMLTDDMSEIAKQSRARFRSHLIFRDLEQEMDEIDHEQEEEAETFARIFMARVQQHKRNRNLANTQNINLFPPFNLES